MVDSLWATMTVVLFFINLSRACCTTRSDSTSRALVASSKSKIEGFFKMARAMATLCFWPPDSWTPHPSTLGTSSPTSFKISDLRSSTSKTDATIWLPFRRSGAMASVSPMAKAVTISTINDFITDLKPASSLAMRSYQYSKYNGLVRTQLPNLLLVNDLKKFGVKQHTIRRDQCCHCSDVTHSLTSKHVSFEICFVQVNAITFHEKFLQKHHTEADHQN
ncbi:terpene synthase-like sequence-1,8-cineole [Striga asiatica]|uniref:Terpene synthase-like sequence-1,8-cineole n=1 Tax=Striga asiatica TaxID=4170 RepID=A0A5A7PPC1_STRAF|nr:terpene synthase-like sequence-1,8-cineole [Striga asiatica]